MVAVPLEFPPLERDVESSPGGLEHAQALGHRFLADPVAGNDGDPICVHRRLLHRSILTTPHPSGLWRPRTDFPKVTTVPTGKNAEPLFRRFDPSFRSFVRSCFNDPRPLSDHAGRIAGRAARPDCATAGAGAMAWRRVG